MFSHIQYISQGNTSGEQLQNIQSVLDAGYDWIQLRYKHQEEQELLYVGERVKRLCESYRATFIMNDYPYLAKALDADGVHLGLTDTPIADAKRILGHKKIIGGTANTIQDVLLRINEGCHYIGLGPFRFTKTKEKLSPVLGTYGYRNIIATLQEQGETIPVYAIGGIGLDDIEGLRDTGIYGIAVSGLLTQRDLPNNTFLKQSTLWS